MKRRPRVRAVVLVWLVWLAMAPLHAQTADRYAVIISGVSGGEQYATQQQQRVAQLATALTTGFALPEANLIILDEQGEDTARSTAVNVRRIVQEVRQRAAADDVLLLVLLGHGTFDGTDAKFNLVGPDLTAAEWKSLLDGIPGRLVVVNTTESSFPFLEALAGKSRVVITATDSAQQRFTTVFPDHFISSLSDSSSDFDKDGRVSIWEAFAAASAGVKRYYEERGQLSTERPLLDDDGDGVGREAESPGEDGAFARALHLDPPAVASSADAGVAALEQQRLELERQLEDLKTRKNSMPDEQYQSELESILVELAKIAQVLRRSS